MKQHTAWLKAQLELVPGLVGKVFVTKTSFPESVPVSSRVPYVVIHPADGEDDSDRLTGPSVHMHPRFTIHTVATDANAAADVAADIKSQLIVGGFGVVPDIPGEWPQRLWWAVPTPIQTDRDTTPWLVFHVAECGFASQTLS